MSLPWFLLLRAEDDNQQEGKGRSSLTEKQSLYTTGDIGDLSTSRVYTPSNLPELRDTQFLLSRHGWLLLFSSIQRSLFFLNPFSRARINLPFIDVSELRSPTFDISTSPMSPDCTIFVISCAGEYAFKISLCRRGESAWTTKVYEVDFSSQCGAVLNTVFVNKSKGIWYCLHQAGEFSVFDTSTLNWRYLGFPKDMDRCFFMRPLSYAMKHGDDGQVQLNVHAGFRSFEVVLKEPLEVIRIECGILWLGEIELSFRTCLERAILEYQNELLVDSFNTNAWCGKLDSAKKQMISFQWHQFRGYVDNLDEMNGMGCPVEGNSKKCCPIVALFEPEWINPSQVVDWITG